MAKDTNTSKCPEMVSGCKSSCSIKTEKYVCNDGFILNFSVVMSGVPLVKEEINYITRIISLKLARLVEDFRSEPEDCGQLTLDF